MDELYADAQKQADAYYDQYGYYTDATAFLSQEYYDLQNSIYDTNDEIWAAEKSIKNYNKAMEEDADAVADAEAEISLAEEAVKNLTDAMNEGNGASEEAAAQTSEFQAAISSVQEKISALVESYTEAYSAAYESISGQYLYDKMVDRDFIRAVILEAAKGRQSRKDIARILADLDGYVEKTYEIVATESFVPSEPRVREIYDESSEKFRKIKMVPFWPDGVIQWMMVTVMKPVLMRGMHPWSCASIPGRGGKRVHKKISSALRNDPKGTKYAAELDVAQYYPSISGRRLIWALARKIKDKRFLRAVYSIIESCGGGLAIGY